MDPAALASPLATAVHPSSSREGMEGSFSGGGDDLQSKGDGGGARLGLQEREREDVREREKEGEEDKEREEIGEGGVVSDWRGWVEGTPPAHRRSHRVVLDSIYMRERERERMRGRERRKERRIKRKERGEGGAVANR